jgi:hypothetical protein
MTIQEHQGREASHPLKKPVPYLNDLTVFVISSGEETSNDCMAALDAQDSTFLIEHIRDVAPMSAAFQAMPDLCRTPYFIQVDADMILKPDAVGKLYNAIRQSPFWVYRIAGTLYEEGFGIGGAVKCWKRNLFRFVSFHDCRTVDRELHNRLRWFGLRIDRVEEVVGVHRPRHSFFSLYLKTKSDIEKWRFLKRSSSRYALPLIDEIFVDVNTCGHRLLGALLGTLTGPERLVRSKDTPLEKERFGALLVLLGREESLPGITLAGLDRDSFCATFASAFDDFRGTDCRKREPLLKIIADIYLARETRQERFVDTLLEVIDR